MQPPIYSALGQHAAGLSPVAVPVLVPVRTGTPRPTGSSEGGDSTRLRIAAALLQGAELCVCDTAWVVGASQALVSHHLRQLRTVGVVTSRRDGRMVMYQLSDRGRAVLSVLVEVDNGTAVDTDGDGDAVLEGADRV